LVLETIFKKEKKEMTKIKKEEPVVKQKPVKKDGSESIGLMQREKELVKRSDELNALVTELDAELNQVRENLETKGWIQSADGWVIG
jgi:Skp family chaperone for outer membrane proteins